MKWHYRHADLLHIPTEIPGLVVLEDRNVLLEHVSSNWLAGCPRLERSDGKAWFVVAKVRPRYPQDHSYHWCDVIYIDEAVVSGLLWTDNKGLSEPSAVWRYPKQGWIGLFGFRKLPIDPALQPELVENQSPRLSAVAFHRVVSAVREGWDSWPKQATHTVNVGHDISAVPGVTYTVPFPLWEFGALIHPSVTAWLESVFPGSLGPPRRYSATEIAVSRITHDPWLISAIQQGRVPSTMN